MMRILNSGERAQNKKNLGGRNAYFPPGYTGRDWRRTADSFFQNWNRGRETKNKVFVPDP